jgi:hypothetical protein
VFADAYQKAAGFTWPVIISFLRPDGTCGSAIGAFVVLNDEGWILTAAHILAETERMAGLKKMFTDHTAARDAIINDPGLLSEQKKKKLKKLGDPDPKWVQDYSFWWGKNEHRLLNAILVKEADLAIAKLDHFDPASVTNYPQIKDPTKGILPGTSLCRMGFPFHSITPTYANGGFLLPTGTFPMALFPNEGIMTRLLEVDPTPPIWAGYIETSSPGLMGQSGGPLFDRQGTVWGIQSHTSHLPLGFSPPVPGAPGGQVEHQFLNVGKGVHPRTIVEALTKSGIKHAISGY